MINLTPDLLPFFATHQFFVCDAELKTSQFKEKTSLLPPVFNFPAVPKSAVQKVEFFFYSLKKFFDPQNLIQRQKTLALFNLIKVLQYSCFPSCTPQYLLLLKHIFTLFKLLLLILMAVCIQWWIQYVKRYNQKDKSSRSNGSLSQ